MENPPKIKMASIEEAITRLLQGKKFYAEVIAGITRRAVPESVCETMAVCCNPDTYLGVELIYSQKFIESIESMEFFEFSIEHECVHLMLKHIQRYWTDKRLKNIPHKVFNIGADMAVNSVVAKHYSAELRKELVDKYCMPEKEEFPECLSMENYCLLILQKYKDKDPEGYSIVNPHLWDKKIDIDSEGKEMLVPGEPSETKKSNSNQELNLPDYIEKCLDNFNKRAGQLPGYMEEIVSGIVHIDTPFSWREILETSVKRGMPALRKKSMVRPSRRLWGIPEVYKFPGKVTDRIYKIVFCIDTSGSMTSSDIEATFGLLKSLMDFYENIEVTVVQADTKVHDVQKINHYSTFDKKIVGRGGTSFIQPLEFIEEELSPDVVVYTTDGFGEAPSKKPLFKLVWLITSGSYRDSYRDRYFENLGTLGEMIYVEY